MKRIFLILIIASLLFPTLVLAKTFGRGITVEETTQISSILDQPNMYVGKQVKISGLIVDVCVARSCWIYIAGDRPFDKLRVKVVDGEIVFPVEASGQQAEVEGVIEIFELTQDEVIEKQMHYALKNGEVFDPASVSSGETVVRLRGLGAEIPGL